MRSLLILVLISHLAFSGITQGSADNTPCPCCTDHHRQFDFWLGDWNAYRPSGNLAGTNRITLMQDSCVLREEWKSASSGYTGTSYNYYDSSDSTWNQLWIDNQGSQLKLKGGFTGGSMVLSSDTTKGPNGPVYIDRITWTPKADGTVRQLWERDYPRDSTVVLFDGIYRRKR